MKCRTVRDQRTYCPNNQCRNHALGTTPGSSSKKFQKYGSYRTLKGQKIARFRCRSCGRTVSNRIASIDFCMKIRGINSVVFQYFSEGLCNRQIARIVGIDEKTVRCRIKRLAQQALLQHSRRISSHKICEPICYDGLENFARSQYEPNNINQAIGRNSLFIYDFNFCPLNRKGRMSDRQKLKKEKLELSLGEFRKNAVTTATSTILERLHGSSDPQYGLTILSDQHFQYRRSRLQLEAKAIKFEHLTISSKAPRVYRHILFPVNHADLLIRQHVKAFQRETISFSKTHGHMVQKFSLFMAWKNYFRPQFTKKQKLNPKSNYQTPAMALGIESRILKFRDFFGYRYLPSQVKCSNEWNLYYKAQVPDFRTRKVAGEDQHYCPHN